MQRKTVRRAARMVFTWTIVLVMALDSASACHPFRVWTRHCYVASPVYCGPTVYTVAPVCEPVPCSPMEIDPCSAGAVYDCGEAAGCGPVESDQATGSPHESLRPATEPPASPAEPTPADQARPLPASPPTQQAPPAEKAGDDTSLPDDSAQSTEPSTDLSPNDENQPPEAQGPKAAAEPAAEQPTKDLDDLFGAPSAEKPRHPRTPATDQPAATAQAPQTTWTICLASPPRRPPSPRPRRPLREAAGSGPWTSSRPQTWRTCSKTLPPSPVPPMAGRHSPLRRTRNRPPQRPRICSATTPTTTPRKRTPRRPSPLSLIPPRAI